MENILFNIKNSTNNIKKIIMNLENNNLRSTKNNNKKIILYVDTYFDSLSKIYDLIENKKITPTQEIYDTILTNIHYYFSPKILNHWTIYYNFKKFYSIFNTMIIDYNISFDENLVILYDNCHLTDKFIIILKYYISSNRILTENETLASMKNINNYLYNDAKIFDLMHVSDLTIKCAFKYNNMIKFIEYLSTNKNINFDNEHLNITIENGTYALYLFLTNGENIILTQKHLENACLHFKDVANIYHANSNAQYIIICDLLNRKIMPTQKCIHNLLSTINIVYWKKINEKSDFYKNIEYIIMLLIKMGLTITQEDLELLTEKMIELDSIHKYNVEINDKIIEICNKIGFFPYSIKPTNDGLFYAIHNNTRLSIIKNMIKTHNLVPNIKCMEEAYKIKNKNTIKYLNNNFNLQ